MNHPHAGKFIFIDRAVNVQTGTLKVLAEFPNPDKILRPGMFARIVVDLGIKTDSITIPERALVEVQGKHFAWIALPNGTASQKMITLGEQSGNDYIVSHGLQFGDKLIVEGIQKVREGLPVKAMTHEEMSALKMKLFTPSNKSN